MKHTSNEMRVDFVCDTYPDISIKNAERSRRARGDGIRTRILHCDQPCPKQWKRYLSVGGNKEELIEFLFNQWHQDCYAPYYRGTLYVTHGECCHCLKVQNEHVACTEVSELYSSQEEADTRLLLHAFHVSQQVNRDTIIIQTPNTDVAVIACSVAHKIHSRILLNTGIKYRQRIIDITSVANNMGINICKALPGFHAFTGSDSTSSFCGHEKKVPFELMISSSNTHHLSTMMSIGETVSPSPSLLSQCEEFVCHMYGKHKLQSINEARYQLFCGKGCSSEQLPPTANELELHLMRACYQAAIWKRFLQARPPDNINPSPNGHGWKVEGDQILIIWMTQPPAPDAILSVICCGCKSGCSPDKRMCSCVRQ